MSEVLVGIVTHVFDKINVAAITLTDGDLSVGDMIHIKGTHTDGSTQIESMQVEHRQVEKAVKGDGIGLKVGFKTHPHDKVFRVIP